MSALKSVVGVAAGHFGFRITRLGFLNRFDAMDEVLLGLRNVGYRPSAIVDGGSNLGQWARRIRAVYRDVTIHLIEPLPKCVEALKVLAKSDGNMVVHPVAATNYGVSELRFNLIGSDGTSTGAQAALPNEFFPEETVVKASNLDALLAPRVEAGALLKLDLQGHEIPALRGATQLLEKVEVLITEASFYPVNDYERPVFAELFAFLVERGFELYDIAALMGRSGDNRLQWGDLVFVRKGSALTRNNAWRL
jgi:FkbM family methyltransferase